jgi:hypothetical protein
MGFTKPKLKEIIREEIIEILSEQSVEDVEKLNVALEKNIELKKQAGLAENEDEPKISDLKSDSVASLAKELGKITREMKTVVNQWKKSEGEEKVDLLKRLKELTAMKKEVEALL